MAAKKISFIGAGKVGTSLAHLLNRRGYDIIGIASRSIESAEKAANYAGTRIAYTNDLYVFVEDSDIVFITTRDDVIPLVVEGIVKNCTVKDGQIFVHVSGSTKADVLCPLEEKGAFGISIHPLQTIANPAEGIKYFNGSLFTIEGNELAREAALELVKSLDGIPFLIDGDKKPLYHMAAVIACNYFVTLLDTSMNIFKTIDIDEEVGLKGLLKLVRGTLFNVERFGTKQALTGPIARGDGETVAEHLKALRHYMPSLLEMYKVLGEKTVDVALAKGSINKDQAKKIKDVLSKQSGR